MANILAIDDEIPILELIKNGLQKDGHTVSTYPSVSQIPLEYLNRYDLIMLDIMMPDTDGFTFCKKIRKQEKNTAQSFLNILRSIYPQKKSGLMTVRFPLQRANI